MSVQNGFYILIADLPDHEELVGEIYHKGLFVALISQERGRGQFDIETPGLGLVEDRVLRKVEVSGFCEAVEEACLQLKGEEA